MALAAKLYTDVRSAERHQVELGGTLRGADRLPIDVQLDDLSASGCLLSGPVALASGELVTIGILGIGMQPTRVIRETGERYGCQFLTPLGEAALAQALRNDASVVVDLPITAASANVGTTAPSTAEAKFPLPVRMAVIVGGAAASWAILIAAASVLFG